MAKPLRHLISVIILLLAVPVLEANPPAASTMAAAMQPFVDHHTMAGTVMLLASKDKVLDVEVVGDTDIDAKKPMTPDTMFWIASMTKPMTCAALMMLVDEGKINVDDPVDKYLPEFKGQMYIAEKDDDHRLLKKPAHPMTIRQLMSHTAGLTIKTAVDNPTYDMAALSLRVPSYAEVPLDTEPGTKFQYTNVGMTTVGRIIEVVSGMPYEEFMQERLFTPLGMTDTTFHPDAGQLLRLAKSYKANAAKNGLEVTGIGMLNADLSEPRRVAWPGGGLFSTANDAAKFCQMFLNGGVTPTGRRLLSEASVAAATRKETGDAVKDGYGFDWFMFPGGYFHSGAEHTEMRVYPRTGLITVFMVQQAGDWPNSDGKEIMPAFAKAAQTFAPVAAIAGSSPSP